ncbi:MAG: DUF3313 domain-containing protein [Gammaproteobacteria bacterium]|nr:DUF3313 domain-containing protein [Gammaproteobacteria bacterium]
MFQTTKLLFTHLTVVIFSLSLPLGAVAEDANAQFENLVAVGDPEVAVAYIDPNADFSVFKRIMMLDTFVAFRSGWDRDQRRGTRGTRITASDMDRIKTRVSELFNSVMIESLEANDGFEVVNEADYDVLLIRAAILDLDVTAPDTMSASRSRTYTAGSGAATLYIELYDSVSGQILGRAADRQTARNPGSQLRWSSRASNTADARRIFRGWADRLRGFLESHYNVDAE